MVDALVRWRELFDAIDKCFPDLGVIAFHLGSRKHADRTDVHEIEIVLEHSPEGFDMADHTLATEADQDVCVHFRVRSMEQSHQFIDG